MSHGGEGGLKSAEKVSRIIWMAPYSISSNQGWLFFSKFQFYHSEKCYYEGIIVGFLENIQSYSICQDACSLLGGSCSNFVHNLDTKECQLFDIGKRDCDETVGPSQPTYEECSSNSTTAATTTTPLTTTSPMQPGNFFLQFLQNHFWTCQSE